MRDVARGMDAKPYACFFKGQLAHLILLALLESLGREPRENEKARLFTNSAT